MENKTTIEQWIEENDKFFTEGYRSKIKYLLSEITKLQSEIEEYKAMESLHKESSHMIRMQSKEILDLKTKDKFSEEVIRVLKESNELITEPKTQQTNII